MAAPAVADPLLALVMFLRSELGGLLETTPSGLPGVPPAVPAVFRPDLPTGYDGQMPSACLVLRPAGGYAQFGRSQLYMGDPRVDVLAYGANQGEAIAIARAAIVSCKQLVAQMWENVLLYSAGVSAGPVPLPDTQTLWPCCWFSVQLVHGELPLATIV